jgi:hypothetical protein
MFSIFKPKRHDSEAIAQGVLRATSDAGIIADLLKEFASSEEQIPRVILGAVIYGYCWGAMKKKDIRVSDAYSRAAEIIASRFKNAVQLVPVSDYVVSELELATFSLELCDYFRQRVPLNIDLYSDVMTAMKAHDEAIRSHLMLFETLIRTVMVIRTKRMTEEISRCVKSNMDDQNTVTILADTLYEQISGVGPLDLAQDFVLWGKWDMSRPRRVEAILPLMSRIQMELEIL